MRSTLEAFISIFFLVPAILASEYVISILPVNAIPQADFIKSSVGRERKRWGKLISNKRLKTGVFSFVCALLFPAANVFADFAMNFSIPAGAPSFTGNSAIGGVCNAGASCDGNDGTRFYELKENIGGVNYWHVIVGEEATGFALEFYTRAGSGSTGIGNFNGFSPDSGGMERSIYGALCTNNGTTEGMCGSGADPLNNSNGFNYSGTGTGDGSKMAMHMVLDFGDGVSQEVYKPFTDRKPLITQTVIDGDMRSEFVNDMRGLSYSDMSSAAPITNRQAIDDPTMPQPGSADFDMSMAQDPHVTAGRFIFTPGSGWNSASGWNASNSSFGEGVYTYAEDGFDVLNVPWAEFFNYSDNVTPCNFGHRNQPTVNGDPGGPDDSCPGRP